MRAIGTCEALLELMMARAAERSAFGRAVIDYDATQQAIARSRIDIEQARLLVLRTAERLGREGHQAVWRDVSMAPDLPPGAAGALERRGLAYIMRPAD
jgi:acyl-CoA dehydrogenase